MHYKIKQEEIGMSTATWIISIAALVISVAALIRTIKNGK